MRIVLASQNQGKLRELTALLDEPRIELLTLDALGLGDFDVEETGHTFEDNARLKAEAVALRAQLPALADDSGLEVDALGGRPGVYSKRYAGASATDADNNQRLLEELRGVAAPERLARFRCVLVLCAPPPFTPSPAQGAAASSASGEASSATVLVAAGACEGAIALAPRGEGGFGYDPLFVPQGWGERTLGEALPEEKNQLSHRSAAVRTLRPQLVAWLDRMGVPSHPIVG